MIKPGYRKQVFSYIGGRTQFQTCTEYTSNRYRHAGVSRARPQAELGRLSRIVNYVFIFCLIKCTCNEYELILKRRYYNSLEKKLLSMQ